ncbi:MAG: hypothetical protein ACFFG0_34965 [Candidatus Thorarchaeota archaeon]
MNSKTDKKFNNNIEKSEKQNTNQVSVSSRTPNNEVNDFIIENLCDENLTTLQKIHAILLNCVNLSKQQKLEFCESERYFMKLYLKKVLKQNEKE